MIIVVIFICIAKLYFILLIKILHKSQIHVIYVIYLNTFLIEIR